MSAPAMTFEGTTEEQRLAEEIYQLMLGQGAFYGSDAPIRQTLNNLVEYFVQQQRSERTTVSQAIEAALAANAQIFAREQRGDDVLYITSRRGSYRPLPENMRNMFRKRLYDPENPLPVDDISVVVSTTRPSITAVEPVFISDYWQQQAGLSPVGRQAPEPVVENATPAAEVPVEPEPVLAAAEPEVSVVSEEPAVVSLPAAVLELPPQKVELAQPVVVPEPQPARTSGKQVMQLPDGSPIDLGQGVAQLMQQHGDALKQALLQAFENDALRRVVTFGKDVFPEANVASLGKNDLRKIRDYILEVNEPLLDTTLIADLYYHNPRQHDYEAFRFSLNYRLSRERDFEFVGVEGARLWSTKGLPALGGKRVKVSDLAPMLSYLMEGYDDSLIGNSASEISRSGRTTRLLTFFEWEYGVLPLDGALAAILPAPLLREQRTAVLRFESPQHYTAYLVELRYPTGNRGGWIQGLEEFFHDHLVPGALINVARGEEPNIFTISYDEAPAESDRLLSFDEKKNKFSFQNVPFNVAVDPDQLLTQARFGRLKNLKALPMNERRKGDVVLQEVFENQGEQIGNRSEPRYRATLEELYSAYNVLRPASRAYLRSLLEIDSDFRVDDDDPDTYVYTPTTTAATIMADDTDDDDENTYIDSRGRRRTYSTDDE